VLVPTGTPQLEELGIQLKVTPSVGADLGSVMLELVPEISEFERYEYYQVGDNSGANTAAGSTAVSNAPSMVKLPIFRRSKIETEVVAQSGETVVMGGLITSTESQTQNAVPILSSIPLLGRLFRHEGIEENKQNLLIFVTATILSERGESLVPIVQEAAGTPAN
jgi:type II secretory pathway component GspD/PulD (secretin)